MGLEGRVVVITGSGSGIGRASALEFAKVGAKVVVADIDGDAAGATVREIQRSGGTARAIETDVSSPDSVRRLVGETLRAYSEVHTLFNNAAVQVNKTI